MRLDNLVLDDAFADRLLAAFDADDEVLADPRARRDAVATLALYALEQLVTAAEAGLPEAAFERDAVESRLAEIAGRLRMLEVGRDPRGVPVALWTGRDAWRNLDEATPAAVEAEARADELVEHLLLHPGLEVQVASRLLPTNEEVTSALVFRPLREVTIEARMRGLRYRLRLDPGSTVVSGLLTEDPEPLAEIGS